MIERTIFVNIVALIIAIVSCLIAHVAGIKYYVRKKAGMTIVPAIVSTIESVLLFVISIVLVQL